MKAVTLTDVATLTVCEKPVPYVDEHSILLKVKAVGVCGSDLRIFRNGDQRVVFPRVMGHEIAGEIVETGKSVKGFEIGDRVALGAHIPCGTCNYCRSGMGHHCVKGNSIGYQFDGGFAEYVLLNNDMVENGSICKFGEGTSFEEASLSEPFSCVINGLEKLSFEEGESVVVFGAGAIGCMFVTALRKLGAGKIIVVQRSSSRREFAKKIGADVCIDPTNEDAIQKILEETDGIGVDVSIVTAPSSEVQNQALLSVKKTGRVLFFAGIPKNINPELNTNLFIYKELSVFGTHGASRENHQKALKWIDQKFVDLSLFITHRYALEETEKAFINSENKVGLKSVVLPDKNNKDLV